MKLLIRSKHFVLDPLSLSGVLHNLDVGYRLTITDFWGETGAITAEAEERVERALQQQSDVLV